MTSKLFSPITLGGVEISNRIVLSPMCQYSAHEGTVGDWHVMHLGQFAVAGTGLVIVEATGVEAIGRITPGCVGLYSNENEAALARVVRFCRDYGGAKLGIQLAHAGRKASTDLPWRGGKPLPPNGAGGWDTVGPSAEPYGSGWHVPAALDRDGMEQLKQAFVQATVRALRLDFDLIEIHSAHGYLLHQFLSPISNRRNDAYGGDLAGRMRFPLEVFEAVRAAWPRDRALGLRLSATDWVSGGWDVDSSVAYAEALKARGCEFIVASSGGSSPDQEIAAGPGYQAEFAADIRRRAGIATMAVGQISQARQAETILSSGQADMIALGRGLLYDPHWPWHAAEALSAQAAYPAQYLRCHPTLQGMPVPGNPPAPKPA